LAVKAERDFSPIGTRLGTTAHHALRLKPDHPMGAGHCLYRRLSYFTFVLRCFRPGMQGRIPLSFNASLNQSASYPRSIDRQSFAQQTMRGAEQPVDLG